MVAEPVLRLANLAIAPANAGQSPRHRHPVGSPLLREIQLRVMPGERVAIVGPSGTGKTTLLRTIDGQLAPVSGEIIVAGHDLTRARGRARRDLRREIGYVAQKHDLVEPLRVHQNVMAGALGRWSTLRALRYLCKPLVTELEAATRALSAVGLAHKLNEPTAALSGGEQQRVALARAVIQAPKLLLADEPVASLDPSSAQAILELLTQLAVERGMALICSLHQPELARRYFDRTLAVTNGTLVAQTDPAAREASRRSA